MKLNKLLKHIYKDSYIMILLDGNIIYHGKRGDFNKCKDYAKLQKYKIFVIDDEVLHSSMSIIRITLQLKIKDLAAFDM